MRPTLIFTLLAATLVAATPAPAPEGDTVEVLQKDGSIARVPAGLVKFDGKRSADAEMDLDARGVDKRACARGWRPCAVCAAACCR